MNLFEKLIVKFMHTRFVNWFITKLLPNLRLSNKYPKFTGNAYRALLEVVTSGDVIFKIDPTQLSSIIIGGKWSHVALYVGDRLLPDGTYYNIIEMGVSGIRVSTLFDVCRQADRASIARLNDDKDDSYWYKNQMVSLAIDLLDDKILYDTGFDLKTKDKMYCTELIHYCDFQKRMGINFSSLVGQKYISPDDMYTAKNMKIIL